MNEPHNKDETREMPSWMKEHVEADAAFQKSMTERIPQLATKDDIKGLATEKSIRDIVHWQKNIVTTANLISGGSKWFYRAVLIIAPLVAALAVIGGGWKWLVALFIPRI